MEHGEVVDLDQAIAIGISLIDLSCRVAVMVSLAWVSVAATVACTVIVSAVVLAVTRPSPSIIAAASASTMLQVTSPVPSRVTLNRAVWSLPVGRTSGASLKARLVGVRIASVWLVMAPR